MILWTFVALSAVYLLVSLAFWRGVRRREAGLSEEQPFVSILVAARDEAPTIRACLRALEAQDYPRDRYEVVVVDDRSEDETASIVREEAARADAAVRLLRVDHLPAGRSGKKHALSLAVSEARGEVLLTTDADSMAEPRWVAEMVRRFAPGVGAVAGYAPFDDRRTLWRRILALEVLSQAFLSMGSIGLGRGLTCVGRSFGFTREAYEAVGGYGGTDHLASGDDTLLLQRISRQYRAAYCAAPRSAVWSAPTAGWAEFDRQRRRHLSTTLHYPPSWLAVAAPVYAFHVLLLVGVPLALILGGPWQAVWPALGMKWSIDFVSTAWTAGLLRERALLKAYLPAAVLYLPYIVVFSALGALGGFEWKARRVERAVVVADARPKTVPKP